ncbi:extensin-like domain-containing protein [Pseudophaeobacter flagellatus]|uniref:extensin-like domain-containing protein n=1 Tax=Pseudophaeobacter flagellatus TaxID=2899119 RepID=UPI001E465D4B|nr:extensin family protein [Pseudophaeobacter flagellatus]MCD9149582.1 extensin family protein [Pseudophaeobacter flagellatus]
MIGAGRIRGWAVALATVTCLLPVSGLAGQAGAPETSLRPTLRPSLSPTVAPNVALTVASDEAIAPADVVAAVATGAGSSRVASPSSGLPPQMRPQMRPMSAQLIAVAARPADLNASLLEQSLVPLVRPDGIAQQALFKRRRLRRGSVCGDIDIQGKEIGAVVGTMPGCGAADAVRVTSVAGVTLSQSSVMTCETAAALKRWISKDVEKAFGRRNRVVSLRVAAHYACRTRNNRPGARVSEHGRGKAIDISGFKLEDGTLVSVLSGWNSRATRKPMRKMWKAACGPFGTVLGPEADRHHRDHFHLDVASYRSGSYCR